MRVRVRVADPGGSNQTHKIDVNEVRTHIELFDHTFTSFIMPAHIHAVRVTVDFSSRSSSALPNLPSQDDGFDQLRASLESIGLTHVDWHKCVFVEARLRVLSTRLDIHLTQSRPVLL